MKNKILLFTGISILSVFVIFGCFPEMFTEYTPKEMFKPWLRCSLLHFLGTNDMGYDIYTELVYASASTLKIGVVSAFFSIVIGTAVGMLSGYLNGFLSETLNMLIRFFLLIPMLPMAIVIAAYLGSGLINIIITIAIMGWCATAKAVRAGSLRLKQTDFIKIQKIMGFSKIHILFKHILPNLSEIIFARFIMTTASAMLTEASLSFIGLGDPTRVTWGAMINFAYRRGGFVRGAFNWFAAPGICITLCVLSLYMINHYIEKQYDSVDGLIEIREK